MLAEKFWTERNYSAAVSEFERVVQKEPKGQLGVQALYRVASTQALFLNKPTEAIQNFRLFIERAPQHKLVWEAQKQIGEILFAKLERYDQSILHYQTLIKTKPDAEEVPEFMFQIAKAHFFLWHFDEALTEFATIIKKFPKTQWAERASYERGVVYFSRAGQTPAGSDDVSSEGSNDACKKGIVVFQEFIKKYPKSRLVPEAKFGIASCLEELDQLDAAYAEFESIKTSYPSPKVIAIKLFRIQERKHQKNR